MLKKYIKNTAASICAVSSVLGLLWTAETTVMADDTQSKLNSANNAIDELHKEQSSISAEISDLNEKAETAGNRINELNDDIVRKQDNIEQVNDELGSIESDMSERYGDMKLRIRYIYESGDLGLTETLISSDEFSEMLNRAEYIQKIYDYDRNELEIMASLYNEHEGKLTILEDEMSQLEELKDAADNEARSLETMLAEKKDKLKLSAEKITELEALAKKYEKQLEEERIAREEEERRKREEDERKREEETKSQEKLKQETAQPKSSEATAASSSSTQTNITEQATEQQKTPVAVKATEAPEQSTAPKKTEAAQTNNSNANYSQSDLDMMSAIIEVEAGDQPYEGRVAVGSVVMNRVESPQFPNTIAGVIYQRGQFSPVASGRFAACLARGAEDTNVQAAKEVLGGVRNVPYLFFRMHYGNYSGNFSSYVVMWDHIFYNY